MDKTQYSIPLFRLRDYNIERQTSSLTSVIFISSIKVNMHTHFNHIVKSPDVYNIIGYVFIFFLFDRLFMRDPTKHYLQSWKKKRTKLWGLIKIEFMVSLKDVKPHRCRFSYAPDTLDSHFFFYFFLTTFQIFQILGNSLRDLKKNVYITVHIFSSVRLHRSLILLLLAILYLFVYKPNLYLLVHRRIKFLVSAIIHFFY